MNGGKKSLTETEIRTRYITPAIQRAGWPVNSIREEYSYTAGRIQIRGDKWMRGKQKKVDYLLVIQDGTFTPLAIVEAKDNNHPVGYGMQQALDYANDLDVPFVFTSNGDSFMFHDKTGLILGDKVQQEISLDSFPSPETLENYYRQYRGTEGVPGAQLVASHYHDDGSGKRPRYYQRIAINRTIEAIAKGQKRILLVMATGTGKTFTAAQIIWRYWKTPSPTGKQKRILFLADRNILVDQTMANDFRHFGSAMTKIRGKSVDKSYEIYLGLYQALSTEGENVEGDVLNTYQRFSPNFFDLIVVDECHRGSSREDSNWRNILDYFNSAIQIGLTATPKETADASSSAYFGDPIYTYSLKDGIEDGFLAPYRVIRVTADTDLGFRPEDGQLDDAGNIVEDKEYTVKDLNRNIILPQRDKRVAEYITNYLRRTDPMAKTIVFCDTTDHAERMRQQLTNLNPDQVRRNSHYVMRITGDDDLGKRDLDSFIDPESQYPVIATTSELMTTGVDAKTCKVIALDKNIESMTKFKQIIGRGTRIAVDYNKAFFTILDFRNATKLFADPAFDGEPVRIYTPKNPDDVVPPNDTEQPGNDRKIPLPQPEYGNSGLEEQPVNPTKKPTVHRILHTISGQPVEIINEQVRIMGPDGKLITESLTDYTKRNILGQYKTLDDFLKIWSTAKRKYYILQEMEKKGIPIAELDNLYGADTDLFDVVVSLAYGEKPLGRKTRAEKLRHSQFLNQYQGKARTVLEALIDKYESTSLKAIEDNDVLRINPLNTYGTSIEIANLFGGINGYQQTLDKLTDALYGVEG